MLGASLLLESFSGVTQKQPAELGLGVPFFPLQSVGFRKRHCRCWAFLYGWAWTTHPCFLQQFSDGKKEQVLLHKTNSSSMYSLLLMSWWNNGL